jgi:hypothetical protein
MLGKWQGRYAPLPEIAETPPTLGVHGSIWVKSTDGLPYFIDSDGNQYPLIGLNGVGFTVNTHTTSQTLTVSDLLEIHIMDSAADLTVTLPSVGSDDVGKWVVVARTGTGRVTVIGADSDTIGGSVATRIYCEETGRTDATIGLISGGTRWWVSAMLSFGIWTTQA